MMRDIIFRGKLKGSGEWLFGVPVFDWYVGGGTANIMNKDCMECCEENMVIPKTVGQYTGQNDIDARKVFEGDVLQMIFDNPITENHMLVFTVVFDGDYIGFYGEGEFDNIEPWQFKDCRIIGNIHDKKGQS